MKNQQPNSNADAGTLEDWEWRIMDFEERLPPIARRLWHIAAQRGKEAARLHPDGTGENDD